MSSQNQPTKEDIDVVPDSYIILEFGYNGKYVFKYDEGIAILSLLKNAEKWNTANYSNPKIEPIPRKDSPELKILSQQEYSNIKMCTLLGMTVEEFEAENGSPDDE